MNLKSLITGKPAGKSVSLTFTRPVLVNGINFEAGTTAVFSEAEAGKLFAAGCAFDTAADDTAAARMQRLNAMLPPPFEAEAMPENWQELPECFSTYWQTNQQLQCLHKRHAAIESKLMELVTKHVYVPGNHDLGGAISNHVDRERVLAAAFAGFKIGEIDPAEAEAINYLKDAEHRAAQALKDWRASEAQNDLLKAKFECSAHAIESHGKLCRAIRALAEIGREIFETRISALGLSQWKIAELFAGSSDFVKFVFAEPSLQNLKLGWYEAGVGPTYYLETEVGNMVALIEKWQEETARFQKLLGEGKKELARAQKVSAAA